MYQKSKLVEVIVDQTGEPFLGHPVEFEFRVYKQEYFCVQVCV